MASVKCLPHMHADLRSVSGTTVKAGVVVYTCMPAVGNWGRKNPLGVSPSYSVKEPASIVIVMMMMVM